MKGNPREKVSWYYQKARYFQRHRAFPISKNKVRRRETWISFTFFQFILDFCTHVHDP